MQGLTSNMERSMKNVLNLLGTEMGRIRQLYTLSKKIYPKQEAFTPSN
jgi:hypothetical protein